MRARDPSAGNFRDAMRRQASVVTIVTTRYQGAVWGMTVSAFCSISADPPILLICVGAGTTTADCISDSGAFGISLLSTQHVDLAGHCATPGAPKFLDDVQTVSPMGFSVPIIDGSLGAFDCQLNQALVLNGRYLAFGRVIRVALSPEDQPPLVYADQEFRHVGEPITRSSPGEDD